MKRSKQKASLCSQSGITAIEYALLIAVLFLAAVAVVPQLMASDKVETTSTSEKVVSRSLGFTR